MYTVRIDTDEKSYELTYSKKVDAVKAVKRELKRVAADAGIEKVSIVDMGEQEEGVIGYTIADEAGKIPVTGIGSIIKIKGGNTVATPKKATPKKAAPKKATPKKEKRLNKREVLAGIMSTLPKKGRTLEEIIDMVNGQCGGSRKSDTDLVKHFSQYDLYWGRVAKEGDKFLPAE